MNQDGASRPSQKRGRLEPRGFAVKVAIGVGLFLLAVTAVVFSGSSATRDTAASGLAASYGEAALGANDVAFRALAQFVLLDEDRLLGVANDEVVEQAAEEAARAIDEVHAHLQALIGVKPDLAASLDLVYEETRLAALGVLEATGTGTTTELLASQAKPQFEQMRDAVAASRDEDAQALFSANEVAGRMSLISRFLVALVLPLGAMVTYRLAARRQIRLAEVQLDAQLEAEQEIHHAKDEFIANLSHELRTPLTSIYGFSEVLIEGGGVDAETAADLIRLINGESAELGRMVEDLLVSARASAEALSYSLQAVNLQSETDAVVAPFTRTGASVEVDVPAEPVWADPLRARQIVRNLVSNAVRHGGPTIGVKGVIDSDRMVVMVSDDGDGVPEEMLSRLFTRFVHDGRAALTEGSVGLGLAVAKELATAMGGGLEYRRDGEDTVFDFWLPLASAAQPMPPAESTPPALETEAMTDHGADPGADPWAA